MKYPKSHVFWLDREIICNVLEVILKTPSEQEDSQRRRLREIKEDELDIFLRVLGDGSAIVTAISVCRV
jgi:hypothetical protein